jgi:hypothetical protein
MAAVGIDAEEDARIRAVLNDFVKNRHGVLTDAAILMAVVLMEDADGPREDVFLAAGTMGFVDLILVVIRVVSDGKGCHRLGRRGQEQVLASLATAVHVDLAGHGITPALIPAAATVGAKSPSTHYHPKIFSLLQERKLLYLLPHSRSLSIKFLNPQETSTILKI